MEQAHYAEVVYLFVDGQVTSELTFDAFEAHIDRQTEIPGAPIGAGVARGGFVRVGPGLRIEGLVFFLLQIDERGRPDRNFNVPLAYLAQNAGDGPDLGAGPVPMACRGSCSVPWHANNLWDPTLDASIDPLNAVARAVERNALGLDLQPLASIEPELGLASGASDSRLSQDQLNELSARHAAQVAELERQHEKELTDLRAVLEAKIELYRQEVARLKTELAHAESGRGRSLG